VPQRAMPLRARQRQVVQLQFVPLVPVQTRISIQTAISCVLTRQHTNISEELLSQLSTSSDYGLNGWSSMPNKVIGNFTRVKIQVEAFWVVKP